jgi:hypothetical protein
LVSDSLEVLWDQLLSRQAGQIQQAFRSLSPADRQEVLAHLQRMSDELGWHPEQRLSAQAALDALASDEV